MSEQRRSKRFDVKLPLEVVSGAFHAVKRGETLNMSSRGVLFTSEAELAVGQRIEYFITMPAEGGGRPVRLRCLGKVVRRDALGLAATVDRYEFQREAG